MTCSRTQHRDAGEAKTLGPLVSSQALYHRATVLPNEWKKLPSNNHERNKIAIPSIGGVLSFSGILIMTVILINLL